MIIVSQDVLSSSEESVAFSMCFIGSSCSKKMFFSSSSSLTTLTIKLF